MRCPFCGEEMERGFVKSGTTLMWRLIKKKVTINPFLNEKKVNLFLVIILSEVRPQREVCAENVIKLCFHMNQKRTSIAD